MPPSEFIDETVKVAVSRRCTQCGLHVPEELEACPNDGTLIAQAKTDNNDDIPAAYEFIEYIGKGGMSVIYKARHRFMKNVVAIKLLQDKLSQDKASFQRFRQEAEASKKLDHSNIIRVDDFGVLDHGAAFLVMDFVEGHSLAEIISQDGALPVERAIPLFMQICEGLAHAHAKGVLHRDLKPSNVLVVREADGTERVKIVDFGIAKMISGENSDANKLTTTGEVFGSPLYMSPEQCMGSHVDARSDVYSMGCLMYEVLSGKPPFVGANPMEIMFKHLNADAEPLSTVLNHPRASELQKVIGRAMDKDREHRYQTFDALLSDLHNVERGSKVRRLRSKLPVFKLAAAGVALAVAAVLFTNSHHTPTPPHAPAREKLPIQNDGLALHAALSGIDDAWCTKNARDTFSYINLRGDRGVSTTGASAFVKSPSLSQIWLEDTTVDDRFVANLAAAHPRVTKLGLGETHVTGKSIALLSNFPNLTDLRLESLDLTDSDFKDFPEMPVLRQIKLDGNSQLTDRTVEILVRRCPKLDSLLMRKTQVDDRAIALIQAAPREFQFTFGAADTRVTNFSDSKMLRVTDTTPAHWSVKELGARAVHATGAENHETK